VDADGAGSYTPSAWQLRDPDNGQPISASRVTVARAAASASGVFRVQAPRPAAAPAGAVRTDRRPARENRKAGISKHGTEDNRRLIDDISGGPADEAVNFGIDGQNYVIDLAADSAQKMRAVIGRYAGVARVVKLTPARRSTRTGAGRQRSHQIRQWALERGLLTSERGRDTGARGP
jgi:hypothetical protein